MERMNRILILAAAISALSGCAMAESKYACGAPEGVTCMSPLELYRETESADHVRGKAVPATAGRPIAAPEPDGRAVLALEGASLTFASTTTDFDREPMPSAPQGVPVRAAARVMRIWFAPYEDSAGDLHMPGHIFSEIEARRWSVGERAPELDAPLERLEPLKPTPTPDSKSTAALAAADRNTASSERAAQ